MSSTQAALRKRLTTSGYRSHSFRSDGFPRPLLSSEPAELAEQVPAIAIDCTQLPFIRSFRSIVTQRSVRHHLSRHFFSLRLSEWKIC